MEFEEGHATVAWQKRIEKLQGSGEAIWMYPLSFRIWGKQVQTYSL